MDLNGPYVILNPEGMQAGVMCEPVRYLNDEARKVTGDELAALVDTLPERLNPSDERLDAMWAAEAERRLELIDASEMPVRDAAEAIAALRGSRLG